MQTHTQTNSHIVSQDLKSVTRSGEEWSQKLIHGKLRDIFTICTQVLNDRLLSHASASSGYRVIHAIAS